MSFTIPTFNLVCNIWRGPAVPTGAPTLTSRANLAFGRRVNPATGGTSFWGVLAMQLLLPVGTDVRSAAQSNTSDYVEVPAGSTRLYQVQWVDDIGKGFPNEHRIALITAIPHAGWWVPPYP